MADGPSSFTMVTHPNIQSVTSTEYARFGGYATLSWTLPEPGTSEFSVCKSETKTCLLHITGYNDVRAASDKFTSRVRFIGHVSSSGTGLFRFVLSDVTREDEGHYKCYRGSPGSGGPIIPDCGQNLVILGCGGRYTGSSGSISSPNYPGNYGNKLFCTYIIDAGETLITLVFKDFITESSNDVVKVYDASDNLLVHLRGDRRGYIVQSAVYYRVVFTTDGYYTWKGFKAVWTVTSSEYARFGGYATLSWTLPDPGTREFSVCKSETKTCLLHVTSHNDVRAASDKFTSRVRFIGHVSSSGTGLFRFVLSDVTWEDEGHYKCYRGSPASGGPIIPDCGQNLVILGCGGRYTGSSGSISSPNYPGNYDNKLYCTFIIDAGEKLITLVFEDFITESSNDVVKVYDASDNLLVHLSGDRQRYIVQSAVYYRVVFTTDGYHTWKGFKAVWTGM
ncbi:scavenger receptor cysteine-rich domain-containing protein DMBT1-like [Haliotis cracherodii]|uniref:scavenger receptor cysteine-rich domain-containing protein DMBT1-like n=1 Tax=Haliotis cracherodii TaxID=6455 RepID=UPI0039EA0AF4